MALFRDRADAGRRLAADLREQLADDGAAWLVLGLPRGGVPVAYEVARALGAALDVFVVRKLGTPGREELAMGALAPGGVRVLNEDIIASLRITDAVVDQAAVRERRELERRETLYRGGRSPLELEGRRVILVDDGLATGASMRAALAALKHYGPAETIVAVPVAAPDTCAALKRETDRVVCAETPRPFLGVGRWYARFPQTSDEEVRALLEEAHRN